MIDTYVVSNHTLFFNDKTEFNPLDVLIKSGDYFTVLASCLDDLIHNLEQTATSSHAELTLQQLVEDLLYLQENYNIIKK